MLQGQQGLLTRFHVTTSLSPNLPDWKLVWVWTNGRACNLGLCNPRAQATCSHIGPDQNWLWRPIQEVVHRKLNWATRGCVE